MAFLCWHWLAERMAFRIKENARDVVSKRLMYWKENLPDRTIYTHLLYDSKCRNNDNVVTLSNFSYFFIYNILHARIILVVRKFNFIYL